MTELQEYLVNSMKAFNRGDLEQFEDPAAPGDLGSDLTQDEINTLKWFVKEIKERFNPPDDGGGGHPGGGGSF
jgi:hypothetical protein